MALIHGGQLQKQIQKYQIPAEDWLDLSTGISPNSYPIPIIPAHVWQQLPQPSQALIDAAKRYYQCEYIVATSGSQAVIKQLPTLFKTKQMTVNTTPKDITVWLPKVGYKEHEKAWRDQGFTICQYVQLPSIEELTAQCVLVVINPNNPTAELQTSDALTSLLSHLASTSSWLVVDEAFMDVISPTQSIIGHTHLNLFVLRSVGKFFGLAGIRIGFLSAHPTWLTALAELSSPWEVNGPAQFITTDALSNTKWQDNQFNELNVLGNSTKQLLEYYFSDDAGSVATVKGTALFQTVMLANASEVYEQLCQMGVYVRLCDEQDALRFGIGQKQQIEKLSDALARITNKPRVSF